jgi:chromosomal replication initiator protein
LEVVLDNYTAPELWLKACDRLREILNPDVYSRWIAVIEPIELSEDALTLAVDNDFYQTWLEDNYGQLIQGTVNQVYGRDLKIKFTVRPKDLFEAAPAIENRKKQVIKQRDQRRKTSETSLNPNYTFDTFIIGSSNSFAHAACLAVAQAPAKAYNPLFIYGGTGLGKTHIMQAIGHHVQANSKASVCYISSESLMNEYVDALQNKNLFQFRKKYRTIDLLLIDDIHFLAGKNALQEEFFHTFNSLYGSHKQIVMTSDRSANEIKGLEQRLVSRFKWGLVTELEPPDLETRMAILRHKQMEAKVTLSAEVIQYIADNVRSNIRALEGALTTAQSYLTLSGRQPDVKSLDTLLRSQIEAEKQQEVTFDVIQRTVAEHYDIRLADMTSKRRPQAIALPRQIAMFLCRKITRFSLPEIAVAFSKTHATVLHACTTISNRMDSDSRFRTDIMQISNKLGVPASSIK